MKTLILLAIPLLLLLLYGGIVLFWASVSQLRFAAYFRKRSDKPPALGASGWLAFHRRTVAGAYRLLWWLVRGAFQTGLRVPAQVAGAPVLCVHGLFMNSTCMWGIRRRLERSGRPTRAVFMGVPLPTPLVYAGPLQRVMLELAERFPDERFDIVAHSIGGVMVREVLRRNPRLADRIGRIVTLGSPHRGTAVLRWIKFGPIYRTLSLDSDYLRTLPDFRAVAPRSEVTTIASLHDLIVYPQEVAHLAGTRPVLLREVSHLGLMTEPSVAEEVVRNVSPLADQVG